MRPVLALAVAAIVPTTVAACGDDGPAPSSDAPGSTRDASADTADAPPTPSDGPATDLVATFGATTRPLDQAFYGITKTSSDSTIRIEVHRNAAPGCPGMDDPTPDYTLILAAVPIVEPGAMTTSTGSLLDYKGDLLGGDLVRRPTSVMLTVTAIDVCPSCVGMPAPSDPDGYITLDANLTFEGGTVTGPLHATHCDSLDAIE